MAFEKAKVIKAAEKFLSQGKISAAIKEYRQIIKHDEGDFTTLNMLGDLLARNEEKEEAAACFLRIAEHYRDQEFRLKSIAMYRKIDKLKPKDPAIAKELAELYAAQGLIADARAQYLVVADAYTRAGETKQTLKVLHRIADLDPQNTEVRLKLAEGYLKEGMRSEAARAFSEAAGRLLDNRKSEKALEAYSKALELQPHDRATLKGLIAAHAALGSADEAAEILEKSVADIPDDPELISMLIHAYLEAEDPAGAERGVGMLMEQDASQHHRYLDVARLYIRLGQENDAARILGKIIEPMLAGREESELLELVTALLERNPDHVPGLKLLSRINWWQRDMDRLRVTLERLVESAESAELVDDERYALTQLVRLAPDEQRYLDRLNQLGGFLDGAEPGPQLADDTTAVPSFESVDLETEAVTTVAAESAGEFEWNSVAEDSGTTTTVSFADLNEDFQPERVSSEEAASTNINAEEIVGGQLQSPEVIEKPSVEAMMRQELESVDFYLAQNYLDIAQDTLDILERQFGAHPEISLRREKLGHATKPDDAAQFEFSVSPSEGVEQKPAREVAADLTFGEIEIEHSIPASQPAVVSQEQAPVRRGLDSGLAEIFEEFRLEAEGEGSLANEDFETHYNMATAYKEMDLTDEAIREFQVAAGLALSAAAGSQYFQCCNMLGHCFMQKGMPQAAVLWFKKGLSAPGRNAEEAKALQYELGSAYEQMDDLPSAIAAFTEVYGVDVGYRDIGDRLMELQQKEANEKKKSK